MSRRQFIRRSALVAIVMARAVVVEGAAHPFHVTIAEVDHNAEAGTLEIALRVYNSGDLETALGRRLGERVDLEQTGDVDALILDYLHDSIIVEPPDRDRATIAWVGKEVSTKTLWLYVEVPLPGGLDGVTITNTLLFEVEADQVNTMVFGRGKDRRSFRFSKDDSTHTIGRPAPKPDDN